jgi:hypothetical protein
MPVRAACGGISACPDGHAGWYRHEQGNRAFRARYAPTSREERRHRAGHELVECGLGEGHLDAGRRGRGGALTLVGSLFASTRDVRRQRRQRIYDELLTELDKFNQWGHEEGLQGWDYNDEVWPWLMALRRSAALTGRTERRRVRQITDLYREYLVARRADLAKSQDKELSPRQEQARPADNVINDLDQAVEKYRRLLARKIR